MNSSLLGLVLAGALAALAPTAHAQTSGKAPASYKTPRTFHGEPDLQGIWTNGSLTVLELQPGMTKVRLTEAEAKAIEQAAARMMAADSKPTDPDSGAPAAGGNTGGYNSAWLDPGTKLGKVNGEYRAAWVIDPPSGKVPYSAQGRAAMEKIQNSRTFSDPELRPIGERCLVGFGSNSGPPMLNVLYNNNYQIQQSPGTIAILVEMPHDVRMIRTAGGQRLPAHVTPWMGDSIGRWEGETLVVETTNINPAQAYNADVRHRIYLAPGSKVVERFTRIAADELLYQFEVSHPTAYTQTWKGEMPLRRTDGPIYEYACHEGNHSLPGILEGGRQEEQAEAAKRAGK